jgi:MFS family permease
MTTAATTAADRPLLTRPFLGWLSAAAAAAVGDGVLYFALGWVASGYGAHTAGWVLSLVLVPRILFMLAGGALGDRWGLRTTLQRTQAGTIAVLALVALVETLVDGSVATLALLAVGLGVVSAVGYPAAGAYPRLFADDDELPRLMSTVSTVLQTARFLGPPAGGLVVAAAGLVGGLIFAAVTAAVLLVALLLVRPPRRDTPHPDHGSVRAGLAAARTTPGMAPLLGAVALVAGSLLPLLSLSVPLLGRRHGWGAVGTGMVESAWVLGSIAVTLVVARRGSAARPVVPLVTGPVLAGAAVVVIALASPLPLALAAALVMGVGTATFTAHVFPLVVRRTPDGMLARFQALVGVVQATPILAGTAALGAAAGWAGVVPATVLTGVVCALAGLLVAASASLRAAEL